MQTLATAMCENTERIAAIERRLITLQIQSSQTSLLTRTTVTIGKVAPAAKRFPRFRHHFLPVLRAFCQRSPILSMLAFSKFPNAAFPIRRRMRESPSRCLPIELWTNQVNLSSDNSAASTAAIPWGMAFLDLEGFQVDRTLVAAFPAKTLFETGTLPLDRSGDRVRVAVSDPNNFAALDELTAFSGFLLEPVVADPHLIRQLLRQTLGVGGGMVTGASDQLLAQTQGDPLQQVLDSTENAAIVRFTRELLRDACQQGASDIHLEPDEDRLTLRFRIDGVLRLQQVPAEIHAHREAIISRFKILSKLNIAEKRLPQDGGFQFEVAGREIDARTSVIPMKHGEGIVLRILDRGRVDYSLSNLGFPQDLRAQWERLIRRSSGLVLVTGPTGSGKTTTLYGSIASLRSPELKIITIEDPIEYTLTGINQVQVQPNVGLTFAAGLRSLLRHDPDVILIGEIRDKETAVNAIQAALTGHMVFSTLHTNDAATAVTRLVDMGIEPFLVSATLSGVLAQRLVRKLCTHCRKPVRVQELDLPADFPRDQMETVYAAQGCRKCHGIGYLGQVGIFELMELDHQIRKMVLRGESPYEIQAYASTRGMTSMRQSGWLNVIQGRTSIDEVLRTTSDVQ